MLWPIIFTVQQTTILKFFHKGKWIPVENMMMDKCIVVKGK